MKRGKADKANIAVLKERVSKLEMIIYGLIRILVLQLAGLFALWVKDLFFKK